MIVSEKTERMLHRDGAVKILYSVVYRRRQAWNVRIKYFPLQDTYIYISNIPGTLSGTEDSLRLLNMYYFFEVFLHINTAAV